MSSPRSDTRFGLKTRLIALVAVLLLAFGAVLTGLTIHSERRILYGELVERARLLTSLVGANATDPLALLNVKELRTLLADTRAQRDVVEALAFDDEGRVLTDGTIDNPNRHKLLPAELRHRVLAADNLFVDRDGNLVQVTRPVRLGGRFLGGVRITFSPASFAAVRTQHALQTTGVGLAFVLAGIVLATLLGRAVTRPLERLTDATRAVADGDFARHITVEGGGEVGVLATSFNEMTRRLRDTTVSRDHVNLILDSLTESLVVLAADGTIRDVNPATCEMLGCTPGKLVGRPFADILADPDREARARELLAGADEPGGTRDAEAAYRHSDGDAIPVVLSVAAMTGEGATPPGHVCVAWDIRERLSARRSLQASEKRYSRLVELAPDAVALITDGTIAFINPAGARLFAAPAPAAVLGRRFEELVAPVSRDDVRSLIDRALAVDEVQPFREQTWLTVDGAPIQVEVAAVPHSLEESAAVQLVARDITERKRVEQLKAEFISTVSHELRTPITSIRGALGLLTEGSLAGEVPERLRRLLEIAHRNSERLSLLIDDILDTERLESGRLTFRMRPVSLLPVVEQSLDTMRAYGESFGVTFDLDAGDDLPTVYVDPDRLQQVLTNLLSNAAKYSPRGGSVRVAVTHGAHRVRLAVSDHGPGIPADARERIFERFAQLDDPERRKGGTGLGLSIARALLERMGGTIGVDSEVGAGSTFFIELPEWREQREPENTPPDRSV